MTPSKPTLGELTRVFLRIGLLGFGGPAAQIALMHRELVEERPWLEEQEFLRALSFCMLLPGPEAMQLATFAGWRLHGLPGGLVAGGLFVLPGMLVIFALALVYGALIDMAPVQALFLGVKATVVVIVIEAILRVARRALRSPDHWVLAGLAFVALFAFAVPFPLEVVAAGLWGGLMAGSAPRDLALLRIRPGTLAITLALSLTGGFNRSSQQPDAGGCNDGSHAEVGSIGTEAVGFTRSATGCRLRGARALLVGHCGGLVE